jgi:hypothetical protein
VSQRLLRQPSVSLALLLALASCAHEPPPPVTLPAPETASPEELRWVVEAALAAHNWTVLRRAPGSITAFVFSRGTGERAKVQISYEPGAVEIRCVKQDVSDKRYDRWVKLLSSEIRKNAAQLGIRRSPEPETEAETETDTEEP